MDLDRELDKIYRKVDRAFREFLTERSEITEVEQIMNKEVITIDNNVSLLTAAKMMGKNKIGSLVVTREKKALGLVIDTEIINVLACGEDLTKIRIKDIMSTPLINISLKASIAEASKMMIQRGGGLVVFERGILIGVVTPSDIIKSLPECPETSQNIDEFMSEEIVSLDESASAMEAIKLMSDKKVGSIIVNKSGKPYSIFTDGDLFSYYFTNERALSIPIQKTSSSPLYMIQTGTSIHKTAYIMSKKKVKRLPVVKDNELIGIITARDLIRAYSECEQ
jgi:predicted transcriptional regulator